MNKKEEKMVDLYKEQLFKKHNINLSKNFNKEEILLLLNSSVLPNSMNINTVKYSLFFTLLFLSKERKQKIINDINRIINIINNLESYEITILKFAFLNKFESKYPKKEFWRFLKEPIDTKREGRKILSYRKFRSVFYFAYNLIKKGENNERFPNA